LGNENIGREQTTYKLISAIAAIAAKKGKLLGQDVIDDNSRKRKRGREKPAAAPTVQGL